MWLWLELATRHVTPPEVLTPGPSISKAPFPNLSSSLATESPAGMEADVVRPPKPWDL
jgi:hypothetical protein